MMSERKSTKGTDLLFAILFLCSMVFLIWKCRIGYAGRDEAFYLTIPYRLYMGDSLLLHEWHLSQLSGLLLYPVFKFYMAITPDMTGIFLTFRYIFAIVWGMAAGFFYYRLKRFSALGALTAALVFLLYVPFGIGALSYNSMGILMLLNACVIAATAERKLRIQYVASGLFLGGAILCCPFLFLGWVFLCLAAVWAAFAGKKNILTCWLYITVGCALVFLIFCGMVLPNCPPGKLREIFPYLMQDPEHKTEPLSSKLETYYYSILWLSEYREWPFIAAAVTLAAAKLSKRYCIGFLAMGAVSLWLLLLIIRKHVYINYLMFPINLTGLYCGVCAKEKEDKTIFRALWLPGLIYSFCIHLGSNQNRFVITSAFSVASVASALLIVRFVHDAMKTQPSKILRACMLCAACGLLAAQIGAEAWQRYSIIHWEDGGIQGQTSTLNEGPEAGILMTPKRYESFLTMQRDAEATAGRDGVEEVLFLSPESEMYFFEKRKIAAFSAWLGEVDETTVARLASYYELLPDKIPDAVYVPEKYETYAEYFIKRGYEKERLESGALLLTKPTLAPRSDGRPGCMRLNSPRKLLLSGAALRLHDRNSTADTGLFPCNGNKNTL